MCRNTEIQRRFRGSEVQRYRGTEVQRCRGAGAAEERMCRGTGAGMQGCKDARIKDVRMQGCRDAGVQGGPSSTGKSILGNYALCDALIWQPKAVAVLETS